MLQPTKPPKIIGELSINQSKDMNLREQFNNSNLIKKHKLEIGELQKIVQPLITAFKINSKNNKIRKYELPESDIQKELMQIAFLETQILILEKTNIKLKKELSQLIKKESQANKDKALRIRRPSIAMQLGLV
jgi:hypothetical protein